MDGAVPFPSDESPSDSERPLPQMPKRWIIERTLAWLMRYRRLRSDFETHAQSSVAWSYTAMIHRMVRHLAPR